MQTHLGQVLCMLSLEANNFVLQIALPVDNYCSLVCILVGTSDLSAEQLEVVHALFRESIVYY